MRHVYVGRVFMSVADWLPNVRKSGRELKRLIPTVVKMIQRWLNNNCVGVTAMFPQYDIQASYREKLEGIVGLPAGLKEQAAKAKGNLKNHL